jgi:hypothetical protein
MQPLRDRKRWLVRGPTSAEEHRVTIEDYVEALDQARKCGGDWEPLRLLLYASVRRQDPLKAEIIQASLIAILAKLNCGIPSIVIAPQVAGIVHYQRLRLLRAEKRQVRELQFVGNEAHLLDRSSNPEEDPLEVVIRREEMEVAVEVVRHALEVVRTENPRQYEVIMAELEDASATARLAQAFGERLEPGAVRALRHRAKKTLEQQVKEIRKGASP